jgi:long-subunit acyl-CoA synthetase (AMP-forming)
MGAVQDPLTWYPDALGELPGSIEMKLVDFPDAGYHATNNPPQGEIWIRGNSVTSGYLDLEKENAEAFTEDGWFKTGDIGEWDKNGQIKIIDRKKNLVKTLNGEYIALEKASFQLYPASSDQCSSSRCTEATPLWPTFASTQTRAGSSPSRSSFLSSRP